MKPDKTSIYDLFDRQRRYAVPLYQRPYVWTKDLQWRPLWGDVCEKAAQVQRGEANAPHFLGAIVTSQRQVYGNEVGAWDIIDGQQRLTTLQILLAACRDYLRETGDKRFDRDLERITLNDGVRKEAFERFKVWPTNVDRPVFQQVITAGSVEAVLQAFPGLRGSRKRTVPKLAEAYLYFYRAIESFLTEFESDEPSSTQEQRVESLFETFRRYIFLVNIELESGDDPQVIFESLNGRGIPLYPSDLVRNFVFMRATRDKDDVDRLYHSYWRQFDERRKNGGGDEGAWWKEDERQGRFKRPRLDLFLFQYLQYRLRREVNIGHLFQEFRKWWEQNAAGASETALADLQRHSDLFAGWLDPEGDDRVSEFARWLQVLDTSTVYPLLFLLTEPAAQIPADEREGILDDLESFLVRRAVCGLTNKQYNRFFVSVVRNLAGAPVTRALVRDQLLKGTGDSVRWPDDSEFGRAFIHRPVYDVMKRDVVTMVLRTLDRALLTAKHERIEVRGKLSIEHVLPQKWESEWPLEPDTDEQRERREDLLHSFGNLALVTGQFNTALGNRGFERKQKELRRITRLLVNQEILEADEWDEGAIVARGRSLFDVARRRWWQPTSPASLTEVDFDALPTRWVGETEPGESKEPPITCFAAQELLDAYARHRTASAQFQET